MSEMRTTSGRLRPRGRWRLLLTALLALPAAPRGWAGEDTAAAPAAIGFGVSPMVLELVGRPGTFIPFEVAVTARDARRQVLEVSPMTFAQNEQGGIHPAADIPKDVPVEVDAGSRRVEVAPGRPALVRGRVFVARGGSPSRVFGLKVTQADAPSRADGTDEVLRGRLEIRVSYVVRLEVRAAGVTARPADLRVLGVELVERQGRAMLRALVENPTEAAIMHVEARCQLRRGPARVGPSFPLVMPVNAERVGPVRSVGRVLSGARVRFEELVPAPLAPGRYGLTITLSIAGAQVAHEAEVEVPEEAFPAQALAFGRPIGAALVSPGQVELSLLRGAPRLVPLVVENTGEAPLEVQVTTSAPGLDWLHLRGDALQIPPRATRRLALTARASAALDGPRYGALRVRVTAADGQVREGQIPVALVAGAPAPARLELAEPSLSRGDDGPAVEAVLQNAGGLHTPVTATVTITDAAGKQVSELSACHGAWLLPGQDVRLRFALPPLGPGRYQLALRVAGGAGVAPVAAALEWAP